MAADLYFDTYKRYKAGTSKIVTWLAETARECGTLGTPQAETAAKVTVALRDFTKFARSIVNATNPVVDVPPTIIDSLKDVIASRKSCYEWFQKTSKDKGETAEQHERHAHFIEVLESVLEILMTHSSSISTSKPEHERRKALRSSVTGKSSGHGLGRLNNVFAHLTLEEPVDPSFTPKALAIDEKPEQNTSHTLYEVERSDDDIILAIFCYVEDRDAVRTFLREIWANYRDGKTGLITAALTTNTAVEVDRRAENELVKSFPGLSIYDKLIEIPDPSLDSSEEDEFYGKTRDIWRDQEMSNVGIASILCLYRDDARLRRIPNIKEVYSNASTEHLRYVFTLTRALTDFLTILIGNKRLCMEDEMLRGLWWMVQNDKIPAWLVFACGTYMDIHDILGTEISRPWDQLRLASDLALQTIREHFKSRVCSRYEDEINRSEENLLQLVSLIKDHVKTDLAGKAGLTKPFHFMAHHPVRCGLILFRISRMLQIDGISLANLSEVNIPCAHLYNAMIQSKLLAHRWADMDALISYHGEERIFVGGPPAQPKDFLKRFYLMDGISIRAFSRERKRSGIWDEKLLLNSIQGRRTLARWAPVAAIFQDRFSGNTFEKAETGIPVEDIEALLNDVRKQPEDDSSTEVRRRIARVWDRSHKLSSTELLSILQEALMEEELNLSFDYLSMNRRCIGFLKQVRSYLHTVYPELELDEDIVETRSLREGVRMIFVCVCDIGSERRKRPVDLTLLRKTAVLLQDIIEREGDVEIKKARALSNMQPHNEGDA